MNPSNTQNNSNLSKIPPMTLRGLTATLAWIALAFVPVQPAMAADSPAATPAPAQAPVDNSAWSDKSLPPEQRAAAVLKQMTYDEKKTLVSGTKMFFIAPLPRLGLRTVCMDNASAGLNLNNANAFKADRTVSYPATLALAATWEPDLAKRYGAAIGGECRAWGVDILLGPGVNIYRNAQCGRNFEYMGEDPFLAGHLVTRYVLGMQSQGVMATAKHFLCNNHEWLRHESDSRVDQRALHEIYARAWYRIVHEGKVDAVMSSYNAVNGVKASQSREILTGLLKEEIGFSGLLMSDWWAVTDLEAALSSGVDLIMPWVKGKIPGPQATVEPHLDRMVTNILTACFRAGFYDREGADTTQLAKRPEWEAVALDAAKRSVTLLKNRDGLLPLDAKKMTRIIVTGPAGKITPNIGGGSGTVAGYDRKHILGELSRHFGPAAQFVEKPTPEEMKAASAVVVCLCTKDSENDDRPFALPDAQEALVKSAVEAQPNTIVVLLSGGALRMTDWGDKAGAILHAYYPGQYGSAAIADVIAGTLNPSGHLPFSMEREFADSPAYGYKPEGAGMHERRKTDVDKALPKYPPVEYKESIYVGYRWYDQKKKEVQFPFGHGLSFTTFDLHDLKVVTGTNGIEAQLTVTNTGDRDGAEVVQCYVTSPKGLAEHPPKELCAFQKVDLAAKQSRTITLKINPKDFAFYDVKDKNWKNEAGEHKLAIGVSSRDIRLNGTFSLKGPMVYARPN